MKKEDLYITKHKKRTVVEVKCMFMFRNQLNLRSNLVLKNQYFIEEEKKLRK